MSGEQITLREVLDRACDWLKFAEAKNGALLALNCAILFGGLQSYPLIAQQSWFLKIYFWFACLLIAMAIVVGIASFLPRLTPLWWVDVSSPKINPNLLFFGHLHNHTPSTLLVEYYSLLGSSGRMKKVDLAYCDQIVTNSRIAVAKLSHFNASAILTLSALITPAGAWAVMFFRRK